MLCPLSDTQDPPREMPVTDKDLIYEHWIRETVSRELTSLHKRTRTIATRHGWELNPLGLKIHFDDWTFSGIASGSFDPESPLAAFENCHRTFIGCMEVWGKFQDKDFKFHLPGMKGRITRHHVVLFEPNFGAQELLQQVKNRV